MKKFNVSINLTEHFLTQEIEAETVEQAVEIARNQVYNGDVASVGSSEQSVTVTQTKEVSKGMNVTETVYSTQEYNGWKVEDVIEQINVDSENFPKLSERISDKELLFTILDKFLDKMDMSEQIDLMNDVLQRFEEGLE